MTDFSILEGNTFYQGISYRIQALTCFLENDYPCALNHVNDSLHAFDPEKKKTSIIFWPDSWLASSFCPSIDMKMP